jgi:hypothetical protein
VHPEDSRADAEYEYTAYAETYRLHYTYKTYCTALQYTHTTTTCTHIQAYIQVHDYCVMVAYRMCPATAKPHSWSSSAVVRALAAAVVTPLVLAYSRPLLLLVLLVLYLQSIQLSTAACAASLVHTLRAALGSGAVRSTETVGHRWQLRVQIYARVKLNRRSDLVYC